jgi:hypothetical protein
MWKFGIRFPDVLVCARLGRLSGVIYVMSEKNSDVPDSRIPAGELENYHLWFDSYSNLHPPNFAAKNSIYLTFQDGEVLGAAVKNLTATSKTFRSLSREFSGFLNKALFR